MVQHDRGVMGGGWKRAAKLLLGIDTAVFDALVSVMRGLFFRFLLLTAVSVAPMLLIGETPRAWRTAGVVLLAGLVWWWHRGLRRGRFMAWTLPLEGAALAALCVSAADPPRMLGVIYVALYFRAFFGSARSAAALAVTYVTAFLSAVALAGALGYAPAATNLGSPGMLAQVPGFALTVIVVRVLVAVAGRQEQHARHQQVLADVGAALAAADDATDLATAACLGATALTDADDGGDASAADRSARAAVAFVVDDGLRVAAATDPALVGELLPALPHPPLAARWCPPGWPSATVVPLVSDGTVAGALLVATAERGAIRALASLASQVGLALARVRAAEELQAREARFRSLVANANDVIRMLDADGTIVHESAAVRRVLGYEPADLIGRDVFETMHPGDAPEMRRLFTVILDTPGDATVATECRLRHADGTWRHVEGTIRNLLSDPAVAGFVVNYRDVTERKQLEAELRHRALHEPLTELPNRALFHDRVDQALRHADAATTVAVIFLDLDDFKQVNDGLGHAAGDAVLRAVAGRLCSVVGPTDTCARLGGDEFGVLLTGARPPGDVDRVATAILEAIHAPVEFAGQVVSVDASLGIAVHTGGETADDLVHNADLAMYRAKSTGKARAARFEAGMHESARRRLELKAELERAIEAGEFVAHYQPIVDLHSDRVVAVETLVRWEHPRRGLLAPDAFLAMAEHSGIIVAIGRQVIAQACRDAAAWRAVDGRRLTLTVNLSARELGAPDSTEFLAATMRAHGIDPRQVVVEVTESMLLLDATAAARTLERLTRLGVRVALDDFGTGFSSLAYLQQFPVDVVKIDKSFVDSLGGAAAEPPLAAAILALCRVLGLAVTAEGVETGVQLDRLRELGCDQAQGYHVCRPLPAADVQEAVRAWSGRVAGPGSRVGV